MKWKIHIVSHTHWDREWYLPFQIFRARLVKMIDSLLNILSKEADFRYFTLDGQTIVLEDYLEIRPDKAEELKKRIKEGRILIGPWYILPDEFLVSGESLIRNLILGEKISRKFGRVMRIGYMPDTFGHIEEMPQILRGFEIDNFVFWRGYTADEKRRSEFIWRAKDGSEVIAVNLPDGYFNAYNLTINGFEEFERKVKEKADRLKSYATTKNILLMNGEDHLFPEEKLPEYINIYQNKHPEDTLFHSNLEIFLKEVRKNKSELEIFSGELRDCKRTPILSGVLSTRIYIKQKNERCEVLLEKYVEPLSVLSYLFGMEYPSYLIWQAWKYLLQNQTHDGICGTSVDEVHREMLTRYAWVEELGEYLLEEVANYFAGNKTSQDKFYLVYNPNNWKIVDRIELIKKDLRDITLEDSKGREIVPDIFENKLIWVDSLPPLGYKIYRIKKKKRERIMRRNNRWIENEFLKVMVNENGSIDIEDKRSGITYNNLNILVDEGDAGDEYNYSPPEKNLQVTSKKVRARTFTKHGEYVSKIFVFFDLLLPLKLRKNRKERSKRKLRCPVEIEYSLYRGIPRVDVTLTFFNRVKDHRLRVLFPTGIKSDKAMVAGHFGVVERELKEEKWDDSWIEIPQPTKPQKEWVDLSDGKIGFMLANKGLPEYEATPEGDIYLTLLRSVGWLSRDALVTRKIKAGPIIQTPEAQCLGTHRFQYSLIPHPGDWKNAFLQARQFVYQPKVLKLGELRKNVPKELSLFSLAPPLVVSSLKKSESSKDIVIRFYNPTGRTIETELESFIPLEEVEMVNLKEEPIRNNMCNMEERKNVGLKIEPYKIVTLKLKMKKWN